MPDEAPGQPQDTPAESQASGPGEGTPAESTEDSGSPADNWQERYENLQPEYTRATQEASQYRQIIDLARQGDPEALAFLGVELDEDDDEEFDEDFSEGDDNDEPMTRAQFEAFLNEQAKAQQEAEAEEQALNEDADYIRYGISEFEKENGELSDAEYEAIIDLAVARVDDQGWPDVAGAIQKVTGLKDTVISSYVENKRKAPQVPAGSSASHQPDLDDQTQRREWMAQQLAAREQSS